MRAIPNIVIVSPADCVEIHKTIEACINFSKPVYIRLTGGLNAPIVYEDDYEFEIGKAVWVRNSGNICIVSAGTTVGQSIAAANLLGERDLNILKLWITQGAELGPDETTTSKKKPLDGVWTNKSGKKIKATLLGVEQDKAILRMANGKIYRYPIASLDGESQRKVREFADKAE